MTFSLRQFSRSRRLRAMGVLAWLMLVVNSLAAAPQGVMMHGHHAHSVPAVAALSEHCHRHAVVKTPSACCDKSGCCGGLAAHACSCAAVGSTTLPPGSASTLASSAITMTYVMSPSISAPSLNTPPPLRPPAV